MSFGFSISDIVTVSQLAYQIYGICTTGRQNAPAEFGELCDALFGLRCALDHLSKHAGQISSTVDARAGEAAKMHQNLDAMIAACANTLGGLQKTIDKYNEYLLDSPPPNSLGRRDVMKAKVAAGWNKMKWTKEGKDLADVRIKIQSHTSAISIVLETFIWTSLSETKEESRATADKTHTMLQKMLDNNDSHLVKEIHQMMRQLLPTVQTPPPSPPLAGGLHALRAGGSGAATTGVAYPMVPGLPIRSAAKGAVPPPAYDDVFQNRIAEVNAQRQRVAIRFSSSEAQQPSPAPPPYPRDPRPDVRVPPSQPLSPKSMSPALWVSTLECTLDTWLSETADNKDERRAQQKYIVQSLMALNECLCDIPDKRSRQTFRRLLDEAGGMARILEKIKMAIGPAVLVEKQVEIYEDDRLEDGD